MEEFYTWMWTKDIGADQDGALQAARKGFEKALELLSQMTDGFKDVSKENLAAKVSGFSLSELGMILDLFRYLTNTSRINFKISFTVWLCKRGIATLALDHTARGQTEFALVMRIKERVRPLPSYEAITEMIHHSEVITRECIDFFVQRDLITSIKRISELGEHAGLSVFLDLASIYQERGVMAAKRGGAAEELVRNKLLSWGAIPGVHFNLHDVSLKEIIERKLRKIFASEHIDVSSFEKEAGKVKSSRQLDLTIPVSDPKILVQSVFYTSDTGGIAHSTVDQNLLTRRHIEACLPQREHRVEFIGLVDGPGWAYLVTDLRKTITGFDDFFQIRSLDSKFRRKLRQWKILLPIDVEEAILIVSHGSTQARKDLVVQQICKVFPLQEHEVSQQLDLFSHHGKVSIKDDQISLDPRRIALVKESSVLGEVLDSPSQKIANGEGTVLIDTPIGTRIVDPDRIVNKLAGIVTREELDVILKNLESNGYISVQKS
jgi:hypothetical protein